MNKNKSTKEKTVKSASAKICERCDVVLEPKNRIIISGRKNPTICTRCAWKRASRLFGDSPLHHRIAIGIALAVVPVINLFGYMVLALTFFEVIKKPRVVFESRINYLVRSINSEQYTPATATLSLGLFLGYILSLQVRYEVGFLIWVIYALPGGLMLGVTLMGEVHAFITPKGKVEMRKPTRYQGKKE